MKPFNFEVKERFDNDTTDKLIKKFLKKTSKSKIVQFCVDKIAFKSKSQKNRQKKTRKRYIKQKIQESYENSLKLEK